MQEKQKCNIIWFQNNLRVHDQAFWHDAIGNNLPLIAVFCWQNTNLQCSEFEFPKIGKFRTSFLAQSLWSLKNSLENYHIPLWISKGNASQAFQTLTQHFDIQNIYHQTEWNTEEKQAEKEIRKILPNGVQWHSYASQTLFEAKEIWSIFGENFPKLFTTFRKEVEKKCSIRPEFKVKLPKFPEITLPILEGTMEINQFNFNIEPKLEYTAFPFNGGEHEAFKRIHHYFFESHHIKRYKETRNGLLGLDYSSKLSAWLANGCLSPVTMFHQIKKYEAEHGANESTYWLFFELLWREFFKWNSLFHQDKIFHLRGISNQKPIIKENKKWIINWINGNTDCDFVNANMIELRETGWMSNRGRQNVASYFCKTLLQDWRIGAAYFESMLLDYDADSNYGNWMYLAGVGNDARNRAFNTALQAQNYDAAQEFRKLWLPYPSKS